MYKGEADWSLIAAVKENPRMHIPVFGNGDVDSPEKAVQMKERYGVDGIMIGRASIGYPWIFNEIKHYMKTGEHLPGPNVVQRVAACKEHLDMSLKWKGPSLGIVEMRRHYTNYFKGLPGIKEHRMVLVTTMEVEEIHSELNLIAKKYEGFDFLMKEQAPVVDLSTASD
jgi:tRNA-dihydrouridine synthase